MVVSSVLAPLTAALPSSSLLRLGRCAPGFRNTIRPEEVQAIAADRFARGAFASPWIPGQRLAMVLASCEVECADACFSLLAAEAAELIPRQAPNWPSEGEGTTALHVAAVRNFFATVRLLLDWKADPESRSRAGLTVLDSAINAGSTLVAHLLLDRGAGSSQPQDALLVAAGSRGLDSLAPRLIQECSADVDGAIDLGVENEDAQVVMQLLQLPGAKQRKWVKQWLLRRAAINGDLPLLEGALALPGLDVNDGAESSVGPALLLAAEGGHAAVCQRLLQARADLTMAARTGLRGRWTAADVAALRASRPEFQEVLHVLGQFGNQPFALTAMAQSLKPAPCF